MPGMAAHPEPFNDMALRELIELFPQVFIFYGFLVGSTPIAFFPGMYPFADALLHIFGIGVQPNSAWLCQGFQGADHGKQLHAVIGRQFFAAEQFALAAVVLQQRPPTTDARIALAGAVRKYFHHAGALDFHVSTYSRPCRPCAGGLTASFALVSLRAACRDSCPDLLPPSFCATGAIPLRAARTSFHSGLITRMPCTRLTAVRKYMPPEKGHQRSPAASMKLKRFSHFSWVNGGA